MLLLASCTDNTEHELRVLVNNATGSVVHVLLSSDSGNYSKSEMCYADAVLFKSEIPEGRYFIRITVDYEEVYRETFDFFMYRDIIYYGGIPDTVFSGAVMNNLKGKNMIEDIVTAVKKYPMMNDYWEFKRAKYEKITVSAYVVASYSNTVHTLGTFRAWERITTKDKWLRIHNLIEWPDFYEYQEDLKKFFDYYLKGIKNDWLNTPRVRYSLIDFEGGDITNIGTDPVFHQLIVTTHSHSHFKAGKLGIVPAVDSCSTQKVQSE